MSDTIASAQARRLAIYCFYDRRGRAAKFIDVFLSELMHYVTDLVVVANGECSKQARGLFSQYTSHIIVRENVGLDAAAYQQAMLSIGWKQLQAYDEIICLNDTVMGPVYPFSEMFEKMDTKAVDFWVLLPMKVDISAMRRFPPTCKHTGTHIDVAWYPRRNSSTTGKVCR